MMIIIIVVHKKYALQILADNKQQSPNLGLTVDSYATHLYIMYIHILSIRIFSLLIWSFECIFLLRCIRCVIG